MGKKEKLREGFVRTNNKSTGTDKPKIKPAGQSIKEKKTEKKRVK